MRYCAIVQLLQHAFSIMMGMRRDASSRCMYAALSTNFWQTAALFRKRIPDQCLILFYRKFKMSPTFRLKHSCKLGGLP